MSMLDASDAASLGRFVASQVEAIDAWNVARQERERVLRSRPASRESSLDAARRLDVLDRVHTAVLARTEAFLSREVSPLMLRSGARAVVAHRHEWLVGMLCDALAAAGVRAVAATANGADALGMVIAEQPDVVLAGDPLLMMPGAELLAEVALFAPYTRRVALVAYSDDVAAMLEAGADSVFTRQVPPDMVAAGVLELVERSRET